MDQVLYQWQMSPTTWVYVSSLIMLAVYFKFNRVFSIRNLDLIALLALAPGPLLVAHGGQLAQLGYGWLFAIGGFFLIRLLVDPMMVRRPLLEPNLSPGGLTFACVALLLFLMTNVIASDITVDDLDGPRRAEQLLSRQEQKADEPQMALHGPGYPLLHLLASVPSRALIRAPVQLSEDQEQLMYHTAAARTMAILSHLAVVVGIVIVGYRHYANLRTGIAAATLYLLLPYTFQMVGRVDHVLPAALLVWAFVAYRRPLLSGMLLGLAIGAVYYPVFLLPLWLSFYWQRGRIRFIAGVLAMIGLLLLSLALTSSSLESFLAQARHMFTWPGDTREQIDGFWSFTEPAYRITVATMFIVLCCSFALWPARKNLGTLLSCSAVVMLGTQFWHGQEGGLYIAWYLPMLLLTIFRPNLEDRVALTVLDESWLSRRRGHVRGIEQAA
jgi:hypothetical protein